MVVPVVDIKKGRRRRYAWGRFGNRRRAAHGAQERRLFAKSINPTHRRFELVFE
jgi:hypothetical protein